MVFWLVGGGVHFSARASDRLQLGVEIVRQCPQGLASLIVANTEPAPLAIAREIAAPASPAGTSLMKWQNCSASPTASRSARHTIGSRPADRELDHRSKKYT